MLLQRFWLGALCAGWFVFAHAADAGAALDVTPDASVQVLRFADLYKRPIGPRGLEPSARLLQLAGARVRLIGYVARFAEPLPHAAAPPPPPLSAGDDADPDAPALPATPAHLHYRDGANAPRCDGPVSAIGTLALGARREDAGRTSYVRIEGATLRCLAP